MMSTSFWLVAAPSFVVLVALTAWLIRNNVRYAAVIAGILAAAASLVIGIARGWDPITICESMLMLGVGWALAVRYVVPRQGRGF